jgi:FMN phosphatase YigB (HAD superfamily)
MAQLVSHTGLRTEFDVFYQGWEARFSDDVCCGRDDFWRAFRSYLLSRGLSRGLCDEIVAAGHARYRLLDGGVQPLAGVRETLAKLECRGVTLVAVCNSPCSNRQLQTRLESMGVGRHFDLVLTSLDLSCTMPQPQFFQAVLAAGRLACDQTALISNHPGHLAGASRAGMLSVAFNHPPDTSADVCLGRFAGLLDLPCGEGGRMLAG